MASAKAKKKRKMQRKLEKKKKKLKKKLAELLKKEIERGAANILKLVADMANLNGIGRRSFLRMAQDETGWRDEKALKALQGRSSDYEPNTNDLDVLKFRTNHVRKASVNSADTPKVKQQPARHFERRAPPPQEPYSVNRPAKPAVFSPRPLAAVSLPRPTMLPVPLPTSQQLIALKPPVLPLMPENWLTAAGVAWNITLKQVMQAPSNHFPPVNFPPTGKISQNSSKPIVYYYHSVTVQCPPGLRPQPVAEKPSAAPPQPEPDSRLQTEQSVANQNKEGGANPKTADSRQQKDLNPSPWRNEKCKGCYSPLSHKRPLKNSERPSINQKSLGDPYRGDKNVGSCRQEDAVKLGSERRRSLVYEDLLRSNKEFDSNSDMDAAEERSCSSEPSEFWSLEEPVEENFSKLDKHEPKNQVFSSATLIDNIARMTEASDGSAASGSSVPYRPPVSEDTFITREV